VGKRFERVAARGGEAQLFVNGEIHEIDHDR
jgi:hypothetical protein